MTRRWTAEELRALGLAMFGPSWQPEMARRLGVSSRSLRRWAAGTIPVPPGIVAEIEALFGLRNEPDPRWRRDEWIVCDGPEDAGGHRREYLCRTRPPRFRARVVALGDPGVPTAEEGEADLLGGIVHADADQALCEIEWFDPPPSGPTLAKLLHRASAVLECWAPGKAPDPPAAAEIKGLSGLRLDPDPRWRRDEWIAGDGPEDAAGHRRAYVVHTFPPRFRARVVTLGEDGHAAAEEGDADLLGGAVYADADQALCEIEWFDPPPVGPALARLLQSAAAVVTDF